MRSVYIETTIPSFFFETRRTARLVAWRDATRRWWESARQQFELCTSRFVIEELSRAPARKARLAMGLLAGVPLLEESPVVPEIVQYYERNRFLSAEAGGDAFHLALASMHRVDFLLTWNCRHLANANNIEHLRVLNERRGLHVPIVTTPFNLMPEE